MIKLIFSIFFITNLFSAMITGNQGKVSVMGGSVDVSAGGVTQTLNSGEITFMGDGEAPSKPRKIKRGDLNDIYEDLRATDAAQTINLRYAPSQYNVVKQIKLVLLKKGFSRNSIKIKRKAGLSQLILLNTDIKKIQYLYPAYYKAARTFFKKKSNKGKVPTLKIKLTHLKKYHRDIFKKYDR